MALVVFLKGVNVGGHRVFRPSTLARELADFNVVNVGAAGTFVVRKPISRQKLRLEFQRRLPFETELMICSRNEILRLASGAAFAGEVQGPDIVRFISILAKHPHPLPSLPIRLPPEGEWLVKIAAIQGRFVFGLYRRSTRTISLLGRLEKHLGSSITTRNWNTFSSLFDILRANARAVGNPPGADRASRRTK
jgi:uncharacterized protein (DUF1697 family)